MYQKQFKDTKDVQLYSEAVWHSLQDQKKRDKKINNNQRNTTKTVVDPFQMIQNGKQCLLH